MGALDLKRFQRHWMEYDFRSMGASIPIKSMQTVVLEKYIYDTALEWLTDRAKCAILHSTVSSVCLRGRECINACVV